MSEVQLLLSDQRVDRTPAGLFAEGNQVHKLSDHNKGRSIFSHRMRSILETKTAEEVMEWAARQGVNAGEKISVLHVAAALNGDRFDREALIDRLEGKAPQTMKQEITGANGGPVLVATIDATALLMELSNKIGDV